QWRDFPEAAAAGYGVFRHRSGVQPPENDPGHPLALPPDIGKAEGRGVMALPTQCLTVLLRHPGRPRPDQLLLPAWDRMTNTERCCEMTDLASTPGQTTEVTTGLYIGGKVRDNGETYAVADPGKPDAVVGYAAAASKQ